MPIPPGATVAAGEDEKEDFHERCSLPSKTETTTLREGAFGNATNLACRECGHQVELGPLYACPECFGPLEIAYDFGAVTREQIEAGPRNIWRYKALLPVPTDIESQPQHRARLHPPAAGEQPRAPSSASPTCG